MKQIAQQHGLKVPAFRKIDFVFDLLDFVAEHHFPVIVKPVDNKAAKNTTVLKTQEDLDALLAQGLPSNMEVEKYMHGDFYNVDGIILDGQIRFICASRMLAGCISYQDGEEIGAYLLSPTDPIGKRVIEYATQLLQALDTPDNTTFDVELFHTVDDEIVLCEVASRTAGVRVNQEIELGYGVNLNQLSIRKQCGLPLHWPADTSFKQYTGYVLIPPRQGTIRSVPTDQPPDWVEEFRLLVKPGQVCKAPEGAMDEIASFVVSGASEEEVQSRLKQSVDWFMTRFHLDL
jgi:biotin carboxylase